MSKNKKIFYGVLVVAVLIAGGVSWYLAARPITPFPQPPIQQVTITTDKTNYKQGEPIKVTIKNNSAREITYAVDFIEPFTTFGIEKKENGEWRFFKEIYGAAELPLDFTPYNFLKRDVMPLKASGVDEVELKWCEDECWEYFSRGETTVLPYEKMKKGIYRISLDYYYFDEISEDTTWEEFTNLKYTSYSHEFRIK